MDQLGKWVAEGVLGVDTLWGGDVMCASGTGRFIADSWFSDEALPGAYTIPAAARIRESGGVASKDVDRKAIEEYLQQVDLAGAIEGFAQKAQRRRACVERTWRGWRHRWRRCGSWRWLRLEKARQ